MFAGKIVADAPKDPELLFNKSYDLRVHIFWTFGQLKLEEYSSFNCLEQF